MAKFSRIAINAKLGDGTFHKGKDAAITFISTDKSLLEFKERLLQSEGYEGFRWGTQKSGYGGTKTIHKLSVYSNAKATLVREASIGDIIPVLDKEDLFLWYMDDGSWHIKRNTMHLYSNMLDESQSNLLIKRIGELYGIDPRLRIDRKRDGRQFYYLYFPRELVKRFRPEFKAYVMHHGLESMYYKFGGLEYEDLPSVELDVEAIRKVRHLRTEGLSIAEIAKQCGVNYDRAKRIIAGKTYKNVI